MSGTNLLMHPSTTYLYTRTFVENYVSQLLSVIPLPLLSWRAEKRKPPMPGPQMRRLNRFFKKQK